MKAFMFLSMLSAGLLAAPGAFATARGDSAACIGMTKVYDQNYQTYESAGQFDKAATLQKELQLACEQGSPHNGDDRRLRMMDSDRLAQTAHHGGHHRMLLF